MSATIYFLMLRFLSSIEIATHRLWILAIDRL